MNDCQWIQYLFTLRAMHSLGEFADIDKWWDENGGRIRSGVIREMAEEYVAGAISRLGNTDKAMEMAARSNDIGAIKGAMRYMGQDTDDKSVLDFIATHCPDNPNAPAFLQEIFYGAENRYEWSGIGEYVIVDPDFGKFVEPCLRAVKSPLCKKPAVWYYTAADYQVWVNGQILAKVLILEMFQNTIVQAVHLPAELQVMAEGYH